VTDGHPAILALRVKLFEELPGHRTLGSGAWGRRTGQRP
jgi:hypothetical protein